MRTKKITKKRTLIIWIVIYICILIFSMLITAAILTYKNYNLVSIAQKDAIHYSENHEFNPRAKGNDVNSVIYNNNLERIDYQIASEKTAKFDFDSYVSKVSSKLETKGIHYSLLIHPNIRNYVAVAIVLPYEEDGIYLFLKELPIIKNIYMVLLPSITLMIIICATFTMYIIKKNQDFERMQREYVDNISHELKSPIASAQALTTAIYDGMVEDENQRKNYCSIILNELQGLEHTVSDMLDLSRIQNGHIDCKKDTCSAKDVFEFVLTKRSLLCNDLSIQMDINPSLDAYPMIITNKMLAERLFDIILDNAIKFTPIGGNIRIQMAEEHRRIKISIKDSGPGIHPEDVPHVFARFYKSDKAHNEKGSGLGLAIAKEIADSLNEQLWISENGTKGAEFSFTIQKS